MMPLTFFVSLLHKTNGLHVTVRNSLFASLLFLAHLLSFVIYYQTDAQQRGIVVNYDITRVELRFQARSDSLFPHPALICLLRLLICWTKDYVSIPLG